MWRHSEVKRACLAEQSEAWPVLKVPEPPCQGDGGAPYGHPEDLQGSSHSSLKHSLIISDFLFNIINECLSEEWELPCKSSG